MLDFVKSKVLPDPVMEWFGEVLEPWGNVQFCCGKVVRGTVEYSRGWVA